MLLVLSTFPNKREAQRVAKALLAKKLVACANIFKCGSLYFWEGKMNEHPEYIAIMKTTDEKFAKLQKEIKAMHPYEIPEIIAINVSKTSPEYAKWVFSCTSKSTE